MLKIQEIRELIKLIDDSSINEFKYEQNGAKVLLKKQGFSQNTVQIKPEQENASKEPAAPVKEINEAPVQAAEVKEDPKEKKESSDHENFHTITSPMVGTFYEAPSPESGPYIKKGDKVNEESIVCIVEAMKLMNEIEAEVNGEIVDILVENGELVEYGQDLFLVKPE
ncbi:acetyl-CoA carboxylase biotin carboxyl carrier protein [Alkalicoccus halolimnae]|uniref:Biotin carboxyl carrier protein of acetyl-CoA carboxylase n=1 Tax=Alkalicoccus halolimnae TaxID=1667239 RepID=A0A5C7FA03_9BACI|nr:acetyl-CoA carboxylase biotin carboxyl carrier protein [Alkalicoccus halolimnae]TXF86370.1 acetyl-CoA carboxylase biotin carboxyl carrier protein [Alkalicoccus halolimnae]